MADTEFDYSQPITFIGEEDENFDYSQPIDFLDEAPPAPVAVKSVAPVVAGAPVPGPRPTPTPLPVGPVPEMTMPAPEEFEAVRDGSYDHVQMPDYLKAITPDVLEPGIERVGREAARVGDRVSLGVSEFAPRAMAAADQALSLVTRLPEAVLAPVDAVAGTELVQGYQDINAPGRWLAEEAQRQTARAQEFSEAGKALGGGPDIPLVGKPLDLLQEAIPTGLQAVMDIAFSGGAGTAKSLEAPAKTGLEYIIRNATSPAMVKVGTLAGTQQGLSTLNQEMATRMANGEELFDAQGNAIPESALAGVTTAVFTMLGGMTGAESVLRESGAQGLKARIATILKEGALQEAPEEMADEAGQAIASFVAEEFDASVPKSGTMAQRLAAKVDVGQLVKAGLLGGIVGSSITSVGQVAEAIQTARASGAPLVAEALEAKARRAEAAAAKAKVEPVPAPEPVSTVAPEPTPAPEPEAPTDKESLTVDPPALDPEEAPYVEPTREAEIAGLEGLIASEPEGSEVREEAQAQLANLRKVAAREDGTAFAPPVAEESSVSEPAPAPDELMSPEFVAGALEQAEARLDRDEIGELDGNVDDQRRRLVGVRKALEQIQEAYNTETDPNRRRTRENALRVYQMRLRELASGIPEENKTPRTEIAPAEVEETPTGPMTWDALAMVGPKAYRGRPEAVQVNGTVLDLKMEDITEENLGKMGNRDLEAISIVMGIPKTGTKAQKIERLLSKWGLRNKLATLELDDLLAMGGKELEAMARQAGTPHYLAKRAVAAGLLNWRNRARQEGQKALAQATHAMRIYAAMDKKLPVSKAAVDEYKIALSPGYKADGKAYIFDQATFEDGADVPRGTTPAPELTTPQNNAEEPPAPEPKPKRKPVLPPKPKPEPAPATEPDKLLGKNRRGLPLFEDKNGVRYVIDRGVQITEAVAIVPTRDGVKTVVEHTDPDFMTAEELPAPVPNPEPVKPPAAKPKKAISPELKAALDAGFDGLLDENFPEKSSGKQAGNELTKLAQPDITGVNEADTLPLEGPAAERAIAIANRRLLAEGYGVQLRPVPGEEYSDLHRAASGRLARAVASLFGRRVVIFETVSGESPWNGFINSTQELKGVIFLHNRATRPHLLTIGHELFHHIEISAPSLARQLRAELEPLISNKAQAEATKDTYPEGQRLSELLADFLAESLASRRFWDGLKSRNPSLFGKLAGIVKSWLDKISDALKRMGFLPTTLAFKDIQRARNILADVLTDFAANPFSDTKPLPYEPGDQNQNLYEKAKQPQAGLPTDKLGAFLNIANLAIKEGINTPTALAEMLQDNFNGKANKYSQALWDAIGMISPDLRGTHDWDAIYDAMDATPEEAPAPPEREPGLPPPITNGPALADQIARMLAGGLPVTRDYLTKLGKDTGLDAKQVDEWAELGVVKAARQIVANGVNEQATFNELRFLYTRQPNLTAKTSESKINQAYSTPAPIAYLGSRLADVSPGDVVMDSAAGNAMLLIEAAPEDAIANELDPKRAERIRTLGIPVTTEDATKLSAPARTPKRIIINPPFGTIINDAGETVRFDLPGTGGDTTQIDHSIALKALSYLPEDGRAVLILGGKQGNDDTRADKYAGGQQGTFWKHLYENYGVVDHFTIDGDLYKKQGAGWPIDVVVIQGRKPTGIRLPSATAPRILSTWEALSNELDRTDAERIRALEPDAAGDAAALLEVLGGGGNPNNNAGSGSSLRPGGGTSTGSPARSPGGGNPNVAGENPDPLSPGPASGGDVPTVEGQSGQRETAPAGERLEGIGLGVDPVSLETGPALKADLQVPYAPTSKVGSLDTLVPVNLKAVSENALAAIEAKVGPLDAYVREKLGYPEGTDIGKYFGAEQVDALSAGIFNMENGGAFILGDQTGIGKGRVAAGMIAYAHERGLVPVFVTDGPNLYSAMVEDFHDIGKPGLRPYFTNNDSVDFTAPDGTQWRAGKGASKALASIKEGLPKDADVIFTTYAQINQAERGFSETPGQAASRKAKREMRPLDDRAAYLQRISPEAVFILDESHVAGGNSEISWRMASFLQQAAGVYYSSATFAKRPDTIGIYYKTALGSVPGMTALELTDIMNAGGVPLQQVVSQQLAESGQYLRRERSFDGVVFDTFVDESTTEQVSALADQYTSGIRTIQEASLQMTDVVAKVNKIMKNLSGKLGAVGSPKLESTEFGEKVHNFVSQYLLAIKSRSVADKAIEAIKQGAVMPDGTRRKHKVVVAVQNTMEGPIRALREAGSELSYNAMLLRSLEDLRTLTVKGGWGKKEGVYISRTEPPQFAGVPTEDIQANLLETYMEPGEEGAPPVKKTKVREDHAAELIRRALNALLLDAETSINALQLGELPLSPIDYMRQRVEAAGIKTGEITGRSEGIDKNGKVYTRPAKEVGKPGQVKAKDAFNNEDVDFIVLNQSGSTGISLHASEKFARQDPRMMIVAQPHLDINQFMQMLGRIHRSGQVALPYFTLLQTALPAEKRPAAILAKKMSRLNANTTSNGKSAASEGMNAPDVFNQYGDDVTFQYLKDDPQFTSMLKQDKLKGLESSPTKDAFVTGTFDEPGSLTAFVTGKMAILPVEEQAAFWEKMTERYNSLISYLNDLGQNELETEALDIKAETIGEPEVFTPAQENVKNSFGEASHLETVRAVMGRMPETAETALRMGREAAEKYAGLKAEHRTAAQKEAARLTARAEEKSITEWTEERAAAMRARMLDKYNEIVNAINKIGKTVKVDDGKGLSGYGVITDVKADLESPLTPSQWNFTITLNTTKHTLKVPASQFDKIVSETDADSFAESYETTAERNNQRQIITGNLLAAYSRLNGDGEGDVSSRPKVKIITYTTNTGKVKTGILLPANSTISAGGPTTTREEITGPTAFVTALRAGNRVESADRRVRFALKGGKVEMRVPSARQTGGMFWRNPVLNAAMEDGRFVEKGAWMVGTVADINGVLNFLRAQEVPIYSFSAPDGDATSSSSSAFKGGPTTHDSAPTSGTLPTKSTAPPTTGINPKLLTGPDREPFSITALVQLLREFGNYPTVNARLVRAFGRFVKDGSPANAVQLRTRLLWDKDLARRVLSHEIGHFVDLAIRPEGKGKRFHTRWNPLVNFRKEIEVRNALKDAARALSRDMRGDFAKGDPYRDKPTELFADAISALLTRPKWTAANHPLIFGTFQRMLDGKPDFKKAYDDLTAYIRTGELDERITKQISESVTRSITESSDLADPEKTHLSRKLKQWLVSKWHRASQIENERNIRDRKIDKLEDSELFAARMGAIISSHLKEKVQPFLDKISGGGMEARSVFGTWLIANRVVNERRAAGQWLENNPTEAVELLQHIIDFDASLQKKWQPELDALAASPSGTEIYDFAASMLREVAEKADKSDSYLNRFDAMLEEEGDFPGGQALLSAFNVRGMLLNPYGLTPETAQAQMDAVKNDLTGEEFTALETAARNFFDIVHERMVAAHNMGLISAQTWNEIVVPNRYNYVPFAVMDYFEGRVGAGMKEQRGTAKDLADPYMAAQLKMGSLHHWMQRQMQVLHLQAIYNKAGMPIIPTRKLKGYGDLERTRKQNPTDDTSRLSLWQDGKPWLVEFPEDPGKSYEAATERPAFYQDLAAIYNLAFTLPAFLPKIGGKEINIGRVPQLMLQTLTTLSPSFLFYRNLIRSIRTDANRLGWRARLKQSSTGMKESYRLAANYAEAAFGGVMLPEVEAMVKSSALPPPQISRSFYHDPEILREMIINGGITAMQLGATKTASPWVRGIAKLEKIAAILEAQQKIQAYNATLAKSRDAGLSSAVARRAGIPNPGVYGQYSQVWEMIFPWTRVMVQGHRSSLNVAMDPELGKGFVLRTMLTEMVPRIIMWGLASGLISRFFTGGDDEDDSPLATLAEFFRRTSPYKVAIDNLIPLGWYDPDTGDYHPLTTTFGKKPSEIPPQWQAWSLRLPSSEEGKVWGSLLWNVLSGSSEKTAMPGKGVLENVGNWATANAVQVSPAFETANQQFNLWIQGVNPLDSFRNIPVANPDMFEAGGTDRAQANIGAFMNQFSDLGSLAGVVLRQLGLDPRALDPSKVKPGVPSPLAALPIRAFSFDNYAAFRTSRGQSIETDKNAAKARMMMSPPVRGLYDFYYRNLGREESLTETDRRRFEAAKAWKNYVWRDKRSPSSFSQKTLEAAAQKNNKGQIATLTRDLDTVSAPYVLRFQNAAQKSP